MNKMQKIFLVIWTLVIIFMCVNTIPILGEYTVKDVSSSGKITYTHHTETVTTVMLPVVVLNLIFMVIVYIGFNTEEENEKLFKKIPLFRRLIQ